MTGFQITWLCLTSLATHVRADLRFASRAKDSYKLRNEGNNIQFQNTNDVFYKYMEPSTFEYQGLAGNNGQKRKNYDQFLRSNIDNEQDNRNFNDDDGEDHLPFRTQSTAVLEQEAQVQLPLTAAPGQEKMIPLRWNNPHASELEVNIWIFPGAPGDVNKPVVVPIKKPTCSGEGYQNNVFKFKIPTDFNDLSTKIPGFTGCLADTQPMCTVQVYAHSVESRMYSYGFPIIITGTYPAFVAQQINNPPEDPRMNLQPLRELCLPSSDVTQHIANAVPQWAILHSDVYNHAYQNSDFSPYSGQQHSEISRNLQASAVNKMVTGNRGELGKNALPQATKNKLNQLSNAENRVYKKYEALANNIINRLGRQMKETGTVQVGQTTQPLANVFRANTAGSTKTNRQQTNTYIPSFQLNADLVQQARQRVPNKYATLINANNTVQIYVAAMNDLMPLYLEAAAEYGILYQPNQRKDTLVTKADATQFKKRNANGNTDGGDYAATTARTILANDIAVRAGGTCPANCLDCPAGNGNKAPLLEDSAGTCVTGQCAGCAQLFTNDLPPAATPPPTPISADLIADPVGDLPATPDVEEVEDYPDEDGTPRVGRPPAPSTTTLMKFYSPGAWNNMGGGGGGGGSAGVVGGAMRPIWDVCLLAFVSIVGLVHF